MSEIEMENTGQNKKDMEKVEKKESPFENSTFNVFDALFVLISMGLLVADLVTDMIVTCKYFAGGDTAWGALTLGFILAPSIILQVFSGRWYLVDDDMSALKWISHICQIGPLHRYVNVFVTGMEARRTRDPVDFERLFYQQSDVCMLRLFESFLESAPQVVLQLYIMVATNDENFWTGTSAAVSLFSLCWALGAYSRAHRKIRRDKKIVSWPGLVLQTIWRIGMISSRVMALVLFASVFKAYIFLAVGIHWIGMMVWVHLQKTDFCTNPLEESLFNCVVAVIYVFCFFNLKEGKSRKRVLAFYSIMFVENTALLVVWYHYRTIGEWYNVAGFTIVFGGFGIGVVSMILYYQYLHPRKDFSLCGPKPDKEPSRSHTTPSPSPISSHTALFSPELYRHGHSPPPKQQHHSDMNHNDNVDSPLARPLSHTNIHLDSDFDKEHGIPHRSGKVKGEGPLIGRRDSVVRKSKSKSCVCYSEDETGSARVHLDKSTAGNTSVLTNASLMASFRCDVSGFGTDLVQRFDNWRDHSHLANHSMMSVSCKSGNISRSLGSMLDQSHVSNAASSHCTDSVDPARTQTCGNTPVTFSPDLLQMPEIADSPNQIMTAYEAQQIYNSILGTHHPRRNSQRKLKFEDDSGKTSGRTISTCKSGNAVLNGKPTQKEIGNKTFNNASGNGGPQRIVVTSTYVRDHGYSVGNIGTSGQCLHGGKQLHHTVPNVTTKDKDQYSGESHKTLTHQSNHVLVETKTKEIYRDNMARNETETPNFQETNLDCPKLLQGSNGDDLEYVLDERREGFQNQNKPSSSIVNVIAKSTCAEHEAQIGIASPRLRAALARSLFKAKEKVISVGSQNTIKADVHDHGDNEAMPELGMANHSKESIDVDELPVVAEPHVRHDEETVVVTGKSGLDPSVHVPMTQDLQCTILLNSNNKTKEGYTNDGKQNGFVSKDNGLSVSGKEQSCVTDYGEGDNREPCENSITKVQHSSPTKAGKLFSSLSPKAAVFGMSQARFRGSHSLLTGERAPPSTGGNELKFHVRSPAGKTNLKRVHSLKGSVPSQSPSHPQGSGPTSDGLGKGHSAMVHENEQERTLIGNLKGKIKRVLSIKAKVPYVDSLPSTENHLDHQPKASEKHEKTVNTCPLQSPKDNVEKALKLERRERPVLAENQQSGPKNAPLPVRYEGNPNNNRIHSAKKSVSESLSLPTAKLPFPIGKENSGCTPVFRNRSTSPQKNGKKHILLSTGSKVHSPGKEYWLFAPGTVKGTVSRHTNDRIRSPVDKKPPRKSLNRIPTNLVAANVARFDSPSK